MPPPASRSRRGDRKSAAPSQREMKSAPAGAPRRPARLRLRRARLLGRGQSALKSRRRGVLVNAQAVRTQIVQSAESTKGEAWWRSSGRTSVPQPSKGAAPTTPQSAARIAPGLVLSGSFDRWRESAPRSASAVTAGRSSNEPDSSAADKVAGLPGDVDDRIAREDLDPCPPTVGLRVERGRHAPHSNVLVRQRMAAAIAPDDRVGTLAGRTARDRERRGATALDVPGLRILRRGAAAIYIAVGVYSPGLHVDERAVFIADLSRRR